MAQDYKSKKQAIKKRKAPKQRSINLAALKWLSVGALLGVSVVMILPYLPMANLANQMKHFALASAALKQKSTGAPSKDLAAAQPPKQNTKPSFDFYTLLPEMKVDIPVKEAPPVAIAAAPTPPNVAIPAPQVSKAEVKSLTVAPPTPLHPPVKSDYIVQIASFKNFSDADAAKTQLLVSGFPVRLQTVTKNGDTLHRLKIGPYKNKNNAEQDRQRLIAMNYRQTIIVTEE